MNTHTLLVVDYTSNQGHKEVIRSFIRLLSVEFDVAFLGDADYSRNFTCRTIGITPIKIRNFQNKYTITLEFILKSFRYIREIKKENADIVLFLGFENYSCLSYFLFLQNNTFAVIHNNFSKSGFSKWIFSFIRNQMKNRMIFLDDYYKEKGMLNIPHPINQNIRSIIPNNNKRLSNNIIFSPSGSNDTSDLELLMLQLDKYPQYLLYGKYVKKLHKNNLYMNVFFENYLDLFCISRYIFLPFKWEKRVSGVFVDAMTLNKIIFCFKANVSDFMKVQAEKYPISVRIVEDFSELIAIKIDEEKKEQEYKMFLEEHSDKKILERFGYNIPQFLNQQ